MRKWWYSLLAIVITACLGFLGWKLFDEGFIYQKSLSEKVDNKDESTGEYLYKNEISKYSIKIPKMWNVYEAGSDNVFESRVEIVPTDLGLKVQTINIDVVSPDKPLAALSTEEEFKMWDEADSDTTIEGITKIEELTVYDRKILILADLSNEGANPEKNSWIVTGWVRDNKRNFYIKMQAKQDFSLDDEKIFKVLLRTLRID